MKKYSEDFKRRCKAAFPNAEALHRALDSNSPNVGRILKNQCNNVSVAEILEATSLEEVKDLAYQRQERNYLFEEWCDNYFMEIT